MLMDTLMAVFPGQRTDRYVVLVRLIGVVSFIFVLSACGPLVAVDAPVTMQAEMITNATEAADLRAQGDRVSVEALATAEAAQTQAASYLAYNTFLLATVQAGDGVAVRRQAVTGSGVMAREMFDLSDGQMRFLQIGAASDIDPNSRCFQSHRNLFTQGQVNTIYLSGLALNLQAGTRIRVDWLMDGQNVHQTTWVAPTFSEYQCFALPLTSGDAPLNAGNWTAAVSINGEPFDPVPFSILNNM